MNVIPTVAQETALRYHKKAGERPMSSAVTADLTALLTRLWLLRQRAGLDDAGDVAATVAAMEEQVEDMVDYLLHRCHPSSLSTLSLQVRSDNLRSAHAEQVQQAAVKKEAIAVQLEDELLAMEPGLVSVEQVWAALAVSLIHHYGSGSSSGGGGSPLGGTTTAATGAARGSGNTNAASAKAQTSTHNDPAYGEAVAAVSAALPRSQVVGFLRQDRVEKAGQVRQVRRIAWGLRLYQKETGRSAGIDLAPLTAAVDTPLAALEARCAEALTDLEERMDRTRALLTSPTCALPANQLGPLREEYHHVLLMLHVLRCVQCGLQQLRDCVLTKVLDVYHRSLSELRELLTPTRGGPATAGGVGGPLAAPPPPASSEAAPKKLVFPKFMELADAYELGMKCADEYNHYAALMQIVAESAVGYTSTLPTSAAEEALLREKARATSTDTGAATASSPAAVDIAALAAEVGAILDSNATRQKLPKDVHVRYCAELPLHTVDPVVRQLYPQSMCAMRGYCPVQFLGGGLTAGLLLPGQVSHTTNPSESSTVPSEETGLGCVEVSGGTGEAALSRPLRFLFADAAAMRTFAADPWRYVEGCLRVFHPDEPTVSLVMGLADELPRELYLEGARRVEKLSSIGACAQSGRDKVDCGTQTGQIDANIDHHYFWNEWDLRRHALKLANVMQLRTHASQTTASHFRRDATTQVNPLKNSETQTLIDAATQPPRVVQYLKGLRGTEASAVEQVQNVVQN